MRALPPVAEAFEREHGCTEADWLGWLPGAVGAHGLAFGPARGEARVTIGRGTLRLQWQPLPLRRIALVSLPRLAVGYRFEGLDTSERTEFMRHFDLFLQRGGG